MGAGMAEPARPYTAASLAERWGCSVNHIRDLIRDGKLQCFRVGRLIRIRRDEVERFECGSSYTGESGAPSNPHPMERGGYPSERATVISLPSGWPT